MNNPTPHRVKLADCRPQPWKNGGGTTRELLAYPNASNWQIRLSVAEVAANGPFSRFEGVQRWFAVLDGAGVELDVGGLQTQLTTQNPPFEFDGAASAHCTLLGGATQDFNLMLRGLQGQMWRVQGTHSLHVEAMYFVAAYAASAWTDVQFGPAKLVLEPNELLWACNSSPTQVVVSSSHALLIVARLEVAT